MQSAVLSRTAGPARTDDGVGRTALRPTEALVLTTGVPSSTEPHLAKTARMGCKDGSIDDPTRRDAQQELLELRPCAV